MMKAVRIHRYDGPHFLRVDEVAVPEPGPDQVKIRVMAAGINHSDLQTTYGTYRVGSSVNLPHGLGQEAAGLVEAVGVNVTEFSPGMRVFGRVGHAFAEQAIGNAAELLPMPHPLAFEVAASLPIAYLTASLALVQNAKVHPGEWVLVHPGSGGVGSATIQLAKLLGARVIATTGSNDKIPYLFMIGADEVLFYEHHEVADHVQRITHGHGVQVAVDGGGQRTLPQCLASLCQGGRMVSYGYTTGMNATLPLAQLIGRNITLYGIALWYHSGYDAAWATLRDRVLPGLINKQIRPVVQSVKGLDQLPEALSRLEQRDIQGKFVVCPSV